MILHLIVICQNIIFMDKVKAIEPFIKSEESIIISLAKIKDSFISLDGYTRLYYAVSKGYYLGGK